MPALFAACLRKARDRLGTTLPLPPLADGAAWGEPCVAQHVALPRVSGLTHGPRQPADTPGAPSSLLLPSPGHLQLTAETSAARAEQLLAAYVLGPGSLKSSGADSRSTPPPPPCSGVRAVAVQGLSCVSFSCLCCGWGQRDNWDSNCFSNPSLICLRP